MQSPTQEAPNEAALTQCGFGFFTTTTTTTTTATAGTGSISYHIDSDEFLQDKAADHFAKVQLCAAPCPQGRLSEEVGRETRGARLE